MLNACPGYATLYAQAIILFILKFPKMIIDIPKSERDKRTLK